MRIFFFLCSIFLFAPSAAALDLLEAYHRAQNYDAQFTAARSTLDAERERLPQARAALLPSLSLGGQSTLNDNRTRSPHALRQEDRYNSHSYGLTLTQPLFRRENFVAYEQGERVALMAEIRFAEAEQNLILRVAEAYLAVLDAQSTLEAAQSQKEAIAQQLEQARHYFEAGVATIIDTTEAESRHDLALAQEIAGINELEIRREALYVLIGETTETLARLRGDLSQTLPSPNTIAPWVESAQKGNLAVQIAEYEADIADLEIARANAGHYPTLDIVANVGKSRSRNNSGERPTNETNNIGLQWSMPLFSGGYVSSKAREAAANRHAALALLEAARRGAALAARQNFLGVVNGLAQIRALSAALASSLTSLEQNKTGYEIGVRINIDVLNAEQQVFTTRRDLTRARHETLLARLRLKNAVGTLSEQDLAEVNALLDNNAPSPQPPSP
ncbi:MAG: TolC family outer membrane protein [Zoogloeaceae bacterium]|jgi:outer membrane protein|nr:TolC family outer membrane protein [Zoogloeaceae bacterium]